MVSIKGLTGSLLVARDGVPLLQAAAGVADGSSGSTCSADTHFQIASVSKQFVAVAVLLLVDDGEVGLSQPIGRLWSQCPEPWRELTLHHLLTHTAGIPHWDGLDDFDAARPGEPEELMWRLQQLPLRSSPGESWHYSSPGYVVASRVVEAIATSDYATFVTDRVLHAIGLHSTHVGRPHPTPTAGGVAAGHHDGRRVEGTQFTRIPGTGDIWSTTRDLARFTMAITHGDLISSRSRQALAVPHIDIGGSSSPDDPAPAEAYGYGCFVGTVCGYRALFHPGDIPGYRSFLGHLPDRRLTIAVLANDSGFDLNATLRQLAPVLAQEGEGR